MAQLFIIGLKGDAPLSGDGVLLVDSGAHYQMGTTDITRTFALGLVSADAVKAASLVLAAHAELARCIFPEGTNGVQLGCNCPPAALAIWL